MGNLFAKLRIAGVDDDAVEPRLEARTRRERITELPRPQERLLNGILGVGTITEDQVRGAHGTRVAVLEPGPEFFDVDDVTHLRDLPVRTRLRISVHTYRDARTRRKVREIFRILFRTKSCSLRTRPLQAFRDGWRQSGMSVVTQNGLPAGSKRTRHRSGSGCTGANVAPTARAAASPASRLETAKSR